MKGEIDKDFFCALGRDKKKQRDLCNNECVSCDCEAYQRKWLMPDQYRDECGKDYPDDWAVYFLEYYGGEKYALDWTVSTLSELYEIGGKFAGKIVCACTPWGKPPADWRPK